jgi:hypothetical protein
MTIKKDNINDVYRSKIVSIETMELRGYTLLDNLFVDSSGFGAPDEPAYTQSQFMNKLNELLDKHGKVTTTITDAGQFQVYVGVFIKTGKNKTSKIGNNTYRINYDDREAIRLHNTDILTFVSDHVTINTGGWQTRTTKDRINKYLPEGVYISQKDFTWYIHDSRDNSVKEFHEGITIAL